MDVIIQIDPVPWDCTYCKREGIMGYIYNCPGCSHPRMRNVVFYDPKTPIVATAAQMKLMGGQDPNWYCLGCDSGNIQSNDACWNCGTPRGQAPDHEKREYGEGQERYTAEEKALLEKETPAQHRARRPEVVDDYNPSVSPARVTDYPTVPTYDPEYRDLKSDSEVGSASIIPRNWLIGIGGAVAALILVWGIWFIFFNTHPVKVEVQSFAWNQTVTIDSYNTLSEQGWSVPAGGRITAEERRKHGKDKISDGYETEYYSDTCYRTEYKSKTCYTDNGNGSKSSRECGSSESVGYSCQKSKQVEKFHYVDHYDTWYWYNIERWVEIARKETSGSNHNPFFDPIKPAGNYNPNAPRVGDQRRVEHLGTYTVFFKCAEPKDFSQTYDRQTWALFQFEKPYLIAVNPFHVIIKYPVS